MRHKANLPFHIYNHRKRPPTIKKVKVCMKMAIRRLNCWLTPDREWNCRAIFIIVLAVTVALLQPIWL